MFLLNRGCVRISVTNSHDREKILDLYSTGVLGENPLTQEPSFQVRATAHEDSWVSIIPRDQFTVLIQKHPAIGLNYGIILCQRLFEAREDIQSHIFWVSSIDWPRRSSSWQKATACPCLARKVWSS
jgi:CRP-like cAMP-binding protein